MVSIIIPAYNEENKIGKTLANLKFEWVKEIIVVNDGSTDNTLKILEKFPVRIIDLDNNIGKGKALEKGIERAGGRVILLLDADLAESVCEADKLIKPVLNGETDITIGVLPVRGGGLGLVRSLAEYGLQVITGKKMKAPLSGQRAISAAVIDSLLPFASGFGLEIGMDIDILKKGYKFKEIVCDFNHNVTGHTIKGYLHRGRQFLSILKTLWQKRK